MMIASILPIIRANITLLDLMITTKLMVSINGEAIPIIRAINTTLLNLMITTKIMISFKGEAICILELKKIYNTKKT